MNRHRLPVLLVAAALLLTSLAGLPVSLGAQYGKVDPLVWEAVREGEEADVLVLLGTKADLSTSGARPSQEAKGQFVYETLRAAAEKSQRDLIARLSSLQADYQSFYIVNALRVRVDGKLLRTLAERPEVARIVPNPRVMGIPWAPPADRPDSDPGPGLGSSPPRDRTATAVEANLLRINADDVWALGYTGESPFRLIYLHTFSQRMPMPLRVSE